MQTTLTRIFIVLESVSHSLHENRDEISRKPRKFKVFFRPKSGGLQKKKKKKKVFTNFETEFSAEISNSKLFFAQNQVVSKKKKKKKKVFTNFETEFLAEISNSKLHFAQNRIQSFISPNIYPNSEIQTFEGGCFPMGEAIFNFSLQIDLKKVRFCILHKPMATLLVGSITYRFYRCSSFFIFHF